MQKKTNFYKKAQERLCTWPRFENECFRNWEVAYSTKRLKKSKTLLIRFTMIIADRLHYYYSNLFG